MATDLALDDPELAEDAEVIDLPHEVLTLDDFLRLPEIKPALEFIDGRIIQKMSPNLPHSLIGTEFPARINASSRPRIGRAVVELRCSFGGESFVPDISFFRRGRLPRRKSGEYAERVLVPPDLTIEIISPGQTVAKLSARIARCLSKGVRMSWLVQPRHARVLVFRPGQPPEELRLGQHLSGDDVIPGFILPLDELFGWLTPED